MRFRPEQHLRRQSDFRIVREQGRRIHCGDFTLSWVRRTPAAAPAPASPPQPRVGVVASTASVGNAVQRARAKRRLRELFRQHQTLVPAGVDLVLTARHSLNAADYSVLAEKFVVACQKLAPRP